MKTGLVPLTEIKIRKGIINLALPIFSAMVLQTAFNIVDTYFVAQLGPKQLAAMGLTFPLFMLLISVGTGLSIGISSLVARSLGNGDKNSASNAALHGIIIAGFIGLSVSMLGNLISRASLNGMGAAEELRELALSYLKILFAGTFLKYVFFAYDGVFRGEGKTKLSMIALMGATFTNLILDPLLIFGIGPFPRMEIAGAALATVISWGLGILISWGLIGLKKSSLKISLYSFKPNGTFFLEIIKVGLPTSLSQGIFALSMGFFNNFALRYSQEVVAAYAIGFRIDGLSVLPGFAISSATIAMMGQNYGARKIERMKEIFKEANLQAVIVMGAVGLLIFAFPGFLVRLFAEGDGAGKVIDYGVVYLRIVSISYPLLAMGFISNSSFQGCGVGLIPFLNVFVRLIILSIPLAYYLSFIIELGPAGLWLGMAISNFVFGILGYYLFKNKLNRFFEYFAEISAEKTGGS